MLRECIIKCRPRITEKRLLRSIVYETLRVQDARPIIASENENSKISGEDEERSEDEEVVEGRRREDEADNNVVNGAAYRNMHRNRRSRQLVTARI